MRLLVVNFHYIRDVKYENGIYPRSLKELSYQIDELSKYYTFISQNELISKIRSRNYSNKDYCLLTFDDGLKEQMEALSLLNKKGVPATFYITTSAIRKHNVVDVHKLHYIRTLMEDSEILNYVVSNINSNDIQYPDNIEELYRYDSLMTKKLKYLLNFKLDNNLKSILISKLFSTFEDEEYFSKKLYMDIQDIKKIDSLGYLGTHCDVHLPLATLSENEMREDISNSIDFLQSNCNTQEIKSISYPYGGPKAVSPKVANISKEFNFEFGLTMFRGLNQINDLTDPMLLKRVDTNDAPGGKLKSNEFCV